MSDIILKTDSSEKNKSLVRLTIGGLFETADLPTLAKWAEEVQQIIAKAHEGLGPKMKVLIDITKLRGYSDPGALTILAALMKADNPHVAKTASWGGTESHEMAQEIIKAFAGRDNLKNFKTEAEATAWLKKK